MVLFSGHVSCWERLINSDLDKTQYPSLAVSERTKFSKRSNQKSLAISSTGKEI